MAAGALLREDGCPRPQLPRPCPAPRATINSHASLQPGAFSLLCHFGSCLSSPSWHICPMRQPYPPLRRTGPASVCGARGGAVAPGEGGLPWVEPWGGHSPGSPPVGTTAAGSPRFQEHPYLTAGAPLLQLPLPQLEGASRAGSALWEAAPSLWAGPPKPSVATSGGQLLFAFSSTHHGGAMLDSTTLAPKPLKTIK